MAGPAALGHAAGLGWRSSWTRFLAAPAIVAPSSCCCHFLPLPPDLAPLPKHTSPPTPYPLKGVQDGMGVQGHHGDWMCQLQVLYGSRPWPRDLCPTGGKRVEPGLDRSVCQCLCDVVFLTCHNFDASYGRQFPICDLPGSSPVLFVGLQNLSFTPSEPHPDSNRDGYCQESPTLMACVLYSHHGSKGLLS